MRRAPFALVVLLAVAAGGFLLTHGVPTPSRDGPSGEGGARGYPSQGGAGGAQPSSGGVPGTDTAPGAGASAGPSATPLSPGATPAGVPAAPSPERVSRPVEALTEEVRWRDGDIARKQWIDPRVVAEFRPRDAQAGVPIAPVPGAQLLTDGRTRLWLLPVGESSVALCARAGADAALAPVLRDSPSSASPPRAAIGLVMVRLDPGWSTADVEKWAARERLEGLARMPIEPNWWTVSTAPGMPAIELAARLSGTRGVVSASPDWWRPLVPK